MRVAAVNFRVRPIRHESQFFDHVRRLIAQAVGNRADFIVFPELPVLELASLSADFSVAALEEFAVPYVALLQTEARRHQITIVGGSHLERNRNVCAVASPNGDVRRVEKHILTQWEKEPWGLDPGDRNETEGVAICYDCEFPELIRPLVRQGVRLLCIPAYTETQHGFQRVRWSAQARALENQIFVVHTSLVGSIGREPVVETVGSSAILSPSNVPFPSSAILARTRMNVEGIAYVDLDFETLDECRRSGDVRNWDDYESVIWPNRIQ